MWRVVLERLYRSVLVVLIAGQGVALAFFLGTRIHDRVVSRADFACFDRQVQERQKPNVDPDVASAFAETDCSLKRDHYGRLISTRAWEHGERVLQESSDEELYFLLLVVPAPLLMALRVWLRWLFSPPPNPPPSVIAQ